MMSVVSDRAAESVAGRRSAGDDSPMHQVSRRPERAVPAL